MSDANSTARPPVPASRVNGRAKCIRCGDPVAGRGLCDYHYAKLRTHLHAAGQFVTMWVPNGPTVERIRELRAAGVGLPRIAEISGLSQMTVGHATDPGRTHVARRTEAAILATPVPVCPHGPELAPGQRIPLLGTRRRLRALHAIGYNQDFLSERLGLQPRMCSLSKLYSGTKFVHTTVRRARQMDALFVELGMTQGPSNTARRDAARKGWPPPMAWDPETIDHPDAQPADPWREPYWLDLVVEWRQFRRTDEAIAERLGLQVVSLHQRLRRAGLPIDHGLDGVAA